MLISCPECHFKRRVEKEQIPDSATIATCPKCQNKFRFRDPETGDFIPDICLEMDKEQSIEPEDNTNVTHEQNNTQTENEGNTATENKENNEKTNTDQTDPDPLTEEELETPKSKDNPLQEPVYQSYEQAEKKNAEKYRMMTDDVPWEHPERYGIIGALVQTISRVMFKGKDFFSTIHSQVSSLRPASFYALIGLFQAIISYLYSPNLVEILKSTNIDPQKQTLIENLITEQTLPMLIISTPFIMIIQLLIYSAFIYLAIRITNPERADFPLTLRIIAYASAPLILCVVPYLGSVVGLIWFIYNIFIGVKYALRLTWQRTFLALAPIFLLWLFIIFNQATIIISALQA